MPPYVSECGTFPRLATVHVRSHLRHRQQVRTVMTLANVSTAFPLQNGHLDGRATFSSNCDSYMFPFWNARSRHKVREA